MSAKDKFHNAVKNALIKDGWIITDDPYQLKMGVFDTFIDLGAERILSAEKDRLKIAVEIKSFLEASSIYAFYNAFGQFCSYREALITKEPDRILFLAISANIYESLFKTEFIVGITTKFDVKLIVFDAEKEEIIEWRK
jgi:XisH protein